MVTVTRLPSSHPPSHSTAHHVGNPPTSFINPWSSFSITTSGLQILKARFSKDRPPFVPVPDRSELVTVRNPDFGGSLLGLKTTWIGHASFLIELPCVEGATRGLRILCDPVFSERTSPVSFLGPKRYTPTPCLIDELPEVDIVIISHSHYDHCDIPTLKSLHQRRGVNIDFIAGLGTATWLHSIGIPQSQAHELDWWDTVSISLEGIGSIKLTCTPTQHASRRTPWDDNKMLWCSYVIEETHSLSATDNPPKKLFFAGDTGYRSIPPSPNSQTQSDPNLDLSSIPVCPAFAQIGNMFGPFDLSLLPIGLCMPRVFMSPVHCNPTDSICLHKDLRSKRSIGMHWGTLRGGISQEYEDVRDPPRWWREEAEKEGLIWRERNDGGSEEGDWEIGLMDVGETLVL